MGIMESQTPSIAGSKVTATDLSPDSGMPEDEFHTPVMVPLVTLLMRTEALIERIILFMPSQARRRIPSIGLSFTRQANEAGEPRCDYCGFDRVLKIEAPLSAKPQCGIDHV
ncbi:hypothetical protein AKJ42_02695 [candidate division MSBL1 archaeon SCGC-AAA261C02]|uniref:Uncharacterized protein n=1 Tax=candidate division MSBL1 archaeon SCGC-AAA261C02 TaxID=1698272 RepID=A0A133UZS1_9EURY|nr:hypothetical protein AKJ42_02695 [candidate division MSBL1 archaeon SCGC-AAA261C02]